jgi:hypothetical protein
MIFQENLEILINLISSSFIAFFFLLEKDYLLKLNFLCVNYSAGGEKRIESKLILIDQQLGRNLARTFLDYYKSTNYVSWSPSCSIMPRLKEDRIKSRLTRQSTNMPIVNQDEA